MRPVKHFEKGLTYVASGVFNTVKSVNQFKPNASFIPKWSDKPLLKSWQKSKPTLGFPRQTDSLCPNCVIEAREEILGGNREVATLINENVGEIKAQIIERDG
ncbi:MAG: radical SAM protein, partial [Acidobacteriota bacterium]|nr:radical SAM protein [Acidobacteriota bacterium]